ncbi:hypothetical protein J8273_1986 [Carpediemonas membranifera]|uniref:Uncharacterized protein n=1 Tax=Carpediemonas membranifera TaxID=201153 RepID=A0A8J6BBP7_9EUKA|nr:hypothetical protein J8273_1986 [Carpediemonas membranifera]|eukprot:KAG9396932.1 hypothetical protein J8273_1986 [Carpediemonas membranifera]
MASSFHGLQSKLVSQWRINQTEGEMLARRRLNERIEEKNTAQRPTRIRDVEDASLYSCPSFPVRKPQNPFFRTASRSPPRRQDSVFVEHNVPAISTAFMPGRALVGSPIQSRPPPLKKKRSPVKLSPRLPATRVAADAVTVDSLQESLRPKRREVLAPVDNMEWTEGMSKLIQPFDGAAWKEVREHIPQQAAKVSHPGISTSHCIFCHQQTKPYVTEAQGKARPPPCIKVCPVCGGVIENPKQPGLTGARKAR